MVISVAGLADLLKRKEDEHLECKEAKNNFHFEKLVKYCVALANEGGGSIVLGVTDSVPHRVVGTSIFPEIGRTKSGIFQRLNLKIDADEVRDPGGRVIVFRIPSRPPGVPISYEGAYWMRCDGDLVPMSNDMLQSIFAELTPDYSAEVCVSATIDDLDPRAIEVFRTLWIRKSGNSQLGTLSHLELLEDSELMIAQRVTNAALVLLGSRSALGRFLAQSEIIFEYRNNEASLPAQQRSEYRQGFFTFYDELWQQINLRNEVQQFQDGLFIWDIPAFDELVIREAVQNAVCHRDYRNPASIFIRQYPQRMEIVSPGGFPTSITAENILWRQLPRNRRIAEAFAKCGLVERSGQGVNRMYEQSIKQSKALPDFKGSDGFQVMLTLQGKVRDPGFLKFLNKVGADTMSDLTTRDLLVLDLIHREQPIDEELQERLPTLRELGVIESIGRGKGVKHILSRSLYSSIGKSGVYTRKKELDHATNKALLLEHFRLNQSGRMADFEQVLPQLSRPQLKWLLNKLKDEGKVRVVGSRRWATWTITEADFKPMRKKTL